MSKKPARTARKKSTPTPQITDAHLVALLSFITYGDHQDHGDVSSANTFANSARAARSMLASQPLTSAFGLHRDRPTVYDEVSTCVAEDIRDWTDPKDTRRAFNEVESARKDDEGDDTIKATDVRDLLPAYIDQSLLLGACLMYELLKGGVR